MTPNPSFTALTSLLALLAAACSAEVGPSAPGNPSQPTSASTQPAPTAANLPSPSTTVPNDASAPDAPAITVADASSALRLSCQEQALQFCTRFSVTLPDVFAYAQADLQQCLNDYYDRCVAIAEAPDTGWTEPLQTACANAWPVATTSELVVTLPSACHEPPGKKLEGQACTFGSQCAGRTCFIKPGEGCGICGVRVARGGACRYSDQCENDDACVDGKCAKAPALAPVGTACSSDAECGYFRYCKGTFVWNETSSTWSLTNGACAAFTTVPNGSACGAFFGPGTTTVAHVDVKACDFGYCRTPSADSNTGICEARPAVGQPCDLEVGCARGACIGGICKQLDANACK